ncbi:MAG: hypothetical protein LUH82_00665 [Clostridiales bacterium]|nr:hypothetical protein [Clostridiales bacterium]
MRNTIICEKAKKLFHIDKPVAIAMWEFSWIERRWPGAGYEDWEKALSELTERGYNAVRIDAFPHLMAQDAYKEWMLNPVWNVQVWGSQSVNKIKLHDNFRNFLEACRRHNVRVALSTWFRQDTDKTLMHILTPKDHANIWIKTMDYIEQWGELDNILYVDFCNEWPMPNWAPFYTSKFGEQSYDSADSVRWMREVISEFKNAYPNIPVTFSITGSPNDKDMVPDFLDFIEQHTWMAGCTDYYEKVGYDYALFDDKGYTNMALRGESVYRDSKEYYDSCLIKEIKRVANWAKKCEKPLITTECWSVVDYKDWPLLNWNWILDLNRLGVETAVKTGMYAGMATSNFCGPQFVGMWRETAWHQELTTLIKNSKMD